MNSTITRNNPRNSHTPKLSSTGPNLSKNVLVTITSLSNNNSDDPLKQHMINQVQPMYKRRDITNFITANTALNLLTSYDDFNKFQTSFHTITKLIHTKHEKANKHISNNLIQH